MRQYQENKYTMHLVLSDFFKEKSEVYKDNIALVKGVGTFNHLVTDTGEFVKIQNTDITGWAEQKQTEEDDMILATLKLAGALFAYSFDINDKTLRAKVNVSATSLRNMTDTELHQKCREIYELGKKYLESITDYGITPEKMNKLANEINDYFEILSKPRAKIVTRAMATKQIAIKMKETDELLKGKIDQLMKMYMDEKPTFYNEYKSARIIVDLGVRHKKEVEE